jgi:hypothetical protein
LILVSVIGMGGQSDPQPSQTQSVSVPRPDQFAGVWDYIPSESINVATGRPEQSARNATQRPPVARRPPPVTTAGAEAAEGSGRGSVGSVAGNPFGPTPEMLRENRDMTRDLLEVPETLRIVVSNGTVTFTDDLERSRVYPTDGRRERYRMGASEFHARVQWDAGRLRKDIEGAFGFTMSETYYLSPDGNRLFVIIRVGQPVRGRPLTGFDRVYERIVSVDR